MEHIELLKHWKKFVDLAIQETYLAFQHNHGLFLTEGDVKCYLFNELRKNIKIQPYTVHSEVTHYANHENQPGYRFRDISLLNPSKIDHNNMELIYVEVGLDNPIRHKGYRHVGEAIFIEIKFQRNANEGINPGDLNNLKTYHNDYENTPKLAVILWVSKHHFPAQNNIKDQLIIALREFSAYEENDDKIHNENVFGFVFNHEDLWEIKYQNDNWEAVRIAPWQ